MRRSSRKPGRAARRCDTPTGVRPAYRGGSMPLTGAIRWLLDGRVCRSGNLLPVPQALGADDTLDGTGELAVRHRGGSGLLGGTFRRLWLVVGLLLHLLAQAATLGFRFLACRD